MSSEVVTKSYFVGKTNETYYGVPIISIVTDADNLFDDEIGIYLQKNCTNKGKEWERPVHIDYIKNNKAVLSQNCGLRIQGGYSRGEYQKSLRLYAKKDYGEKSFEYDFFEGRAKDADGKTIKSFKKITLRNGGNDANYVKYKDSLLQTCVLDRNFSKQASVPCIAFINGEYWGIYTMQEDFNDDYVESHFGVDKDNVVMIKPDTSNNNQPKVEEGNDEDVELWNDFVSYINDSSKDFSKKADYEEVSKMIDLDSFADYVAVETYITNEDWPWKNWEVWRSRTVDTENGGRYSDGKWRFMLYDVEMGAFLWGNSGESSENDKLYQLYDGGRNGGCPIQVLAYKLMQNPQFAQMVFADIIELAEDNYEPNRVASIMKQLHDLYYPNLNKYFERFPTGASIWSANQCEEWINTFFKGNSKYPARDYYARYMVKFNELVIKCEALKQDDCISGYSNMTSKLESLKSKLESTKTSYLDKASYYNKLADAYKAIQLNKSGEVKEMLFDAAAHEKKNYTYETWKVFKEAYDALVDVKEDSSATDNQRTDAMNNLKRAIENLKLGNPTEPTKPVPSVSNNPDNPSNKSSDKSVLPTKAKPTSITRNAASVKKDKKAAVKAMKQAKIIKLSVKSKAKRKINVSWKKVKKAKGYQVQVSTNKKFKKSKIILKKDLKKTKLTIKSKKIKSKKTYFVRVRAYAAYKNTNNKTVKVFSKWNKKLRKVKVKQ